MPAETPISELVRSLHELTRPVIDDAKGEIVAGAPWALRPALRLSWSWMLGTLLPLVIRLAVEALLGRYGPIIAPLIDAAMKYVEHIFSAEVVTWVARVRSAAASSVVGFHPAVRNCIKPIETYGDWRL